MKMQEQGRTYHGWVLVEDGGKDFKDIVSVEHIDAQGHRIKEDMAKRRESGCAMAVEWWDKKVGSAVRLQPTLKGCYRVYTQAAARPSYDERRAMRQGWLLVTYERGIEIQRYDEAGKFASDEEAQQYVLRKAHTDNHALYAVVCVQTQSLEPHGKPVVRDFSLEVPRG